MTGQGTVCLVIGQADIAVHTMGDPATLPTLHHRRKATSILKQDDLLALRQCPLHLLHQQGREERIFHDFLPLQLTRVHRQDLRHPAIAVAGGQRYQTIFSGRRIEIGINRGGG